MEEDPMHYIISGGVNTPLTTTGRMILFRSLTPTERIKRTVDHSMIEDGTAQSAIKHNTYEAIEIKCTYPVGGIPAYSFPKTIVL